MQGWSIWKTDAKLINTVAEDKKANYVYNYRKIEVDEFDDETVLYIHVLLKG